MRRTTFVLTLAALALAGCTDAAGPEQPATTPPKGGTVYPQPRCNPDNGRPCRGYR